MKQLITVSLIVLLAACGGAGNDRPENKPDNSSGSPTTVAPSETNPKDYSTTGVQDSSTTMGYDTGSRKKN